jgi:primosomal protein N' (replication factor Y)
MARVVRVLPDVPAIDKEFDYLVPDALHGAIEVGTVVRITLHGRRVGGWVVADNVEPPVGVRLQPIAKVSGHGPATEVIDLARWAAWRWAGRTASLLKTSSAPGVVRGLPPARRTDRAAGAGAGTDLAARSILRLPPTADRVTEVVRVAALGPILALLPALHDVERMAGRLARAGLSVAVLPRDWAAAAAGVDVVLGSRAAAWGPVPGLVAAVVLDAHDDVYQEERAPTWNAWQVVAERCARAGAPCRLITPAPTVEQRHWAERLDEVPRPDERDGWPRVEVADRRSDDPRLGLLSDSLTRLVRGDGRVICVLNRKGRARLLACATCGTVAACERCGASVEQDTGNLRCRRCATERPAVCAGCGGTRLKNLRPGVSRLAEDLSALAGETVQEVTGDSDALPTSRILIGTEAVLHRIERADAIAFLDFDQELLAPRYRAAEQAMALLVRAARLLGRRSRGGRLLIQTRLPDHDVVQAALRSDPTIAAEAEEARRRELGFPPFSALARLAGAGSAAYAEALIALRADGVAVVPVDDEFLVRASDSATLADALASVPRPPDRLRIEVDPLRV